MARGDDGVQIAGADIVTDAHSRVTMLLTLMQQLREVMQAENALLREMQLGRLRDFQSEKVDLAESYELELRRLRQAPELLTTLDNDTRGQLELALREFQAAVRHNADRLLQARSIVEGVVRVLGESLAAPPDGQRYGTASRPSRDGGRVIAVAFDRRC